MGLAVAITRTGHAPADLRALAAKDDDAGRTRRLLAIAMILDGASRLEAARQTGMERQALRDWVHRYNETGLDGLVSRKPPGAAPKLTKAQMAELRELVIAGPTPRRARSYAGAVSICPGKWPNVSRSRCRNARSANGCAS